MSVSQSEEESEIVRCSDRTLNKAVRKVKHVGERFDERDRGSLDVRDSHQGERDVANERSLRDHLEAKSNGSDE